MAGNELAQLGSFDVDVFDLKGFTFNDGPDARNLEMFRPVVAGLRQQDPVGYPEDGQFRGRDAYYFRAGGGALL